MRVKESVVAKYTKAGFYGALRLIDGLLQRVVEPSRLRVCYISMPDFSDNAYFMYRHVLENRRVLEHVWLVENVELASHIIARHVELDRGKGLSNVRVYKKKSIRGYFAYLACFCTFHTHGAYTFSKWIHKRHIVSLWHGMPIKCIGKLDSSNPHGRPVFGTLHIATSTFFRYINATAFDVPLDKVHVCGMPRCKALRDGFLSDKQRADTLEILNISGKKVVLWMPTFRVLAKSRMNAEARRSFLDDVNESLLKEIDMIAEEYGCVVIVKLHPFDPLNYENIGLGLKSIKLITSQEWIKSQIQLYELVACSDALMSDLSSILIDYLVTGRPMATLGFDEKTYSRDLTFPLEMLHSIDGFYNLSESGNVRSFFEEIASGQLRRHGKSNLANVFYEDFTDDGCEAILELVGLR